MANSPAHNAFLSVLHAVLECWIAWPGIVCDITMISGLPVTARSPQVRARTHLSVADRGLASVQAHVFFGAHVRVGTRVVMYDVCLVAAPRHR